MEIGLPHGRELVRRMYDADNTRDQPCLAAFMSEAVDWPDGEARLHGLAAVEDYWLRMWARVHVRNEVVGIAEIDADHPGGPRPSRRGRLHRRVRAHLHVLRRSRFTNGPPRTATQSEGVG